MRCCVLPWQTKVPATLLGLVERYSPTGYEENASRWLIKRMECLGYDSACMDTAGNVIGRRGQGPRQIVLLGHIDTVPGEIPIRLEGDDLYGRGTVDAKGPLAAFVDAAAQVSPPQGWQVVVIGAVDEEGASSGARTLLPYFVPEYLIVGEPSQWDRITLGYKGSVCVRLTVWRSQAHSSSGYETASEAVFSTWQNLQKHTELFNQERVRLFDRLQLSLRGIASDEDGFEFRASLEISTRLPPNLAPAEFLALIQQWAGAATIENTGIPIPAYLAEKNTVLGRSFLSGIRSGGGKPAFVHKSGTSDINLAAPAWGCQALAYGPGDFNLDHTPDEHLSLVEYERAVRVLVSVLTGLFNSRKTDFFL